MIFVTFVPFYNLAPNEQKSKQKLQTSQNQSVLESVTLQQHLAILYAFHAEDQGNSHGFDTFS